MTRDEKYLSYIRTMPCVLCGTPHNIHAHHTETGGTGIKGSDMSAVPLCGRCHDEVHTKYGKKGFCSPELLEQLIERLQHNYLINVKKGE